MTNDDFDQFVVVLGTACETYDRPAITAAALVMWWEALRDYPLDEVKRAMLSHIRESKFMPRPADLVEQIGSHEGRPSADEAWAMVPRDEESSTVWNNEIAQAWGRCADVMADRVAARMAFRAAYERIVREAKRDGIAPRWYATLGMDKGQHEHVLRQGVLAGHITEEYAQGMLPAPAIDPNTLRIEGPSKAMSDQKKVEVRAFIDAMTLKASKVGAKL